MIQFPASTTHGGQGLLIHPLFVEPCTVSAPPCGHRQSAPHLCTSTLCIPHDSLCMCRPAIDARMRCAYVVCMSSRALRTCLCAACAPLSVRRTACRAPESPRKHAHARMFSCRQRQSHRVHTTINTVCRSCSYSIYSRDCQRSVCCVLY